MKSSRSEPGSPLPFSGFLASHPLIRQTQIVVREEKPPITQLIEMAGIPRLVVGCRDPVPEDAARDAGTLHAAGVSVTMGVLEEDCERLIEGCARRANSQLTRMARQHLRRFGRPMGHCTAASSTATTPKPSLGTGTRSGGTSADSTF